MRAKITLVPRALVKQAKEQKEGGGGGEKGEGEGGETEAMDVEKAAPQKMSNSDFRKLFTKS